MLQGSLIDLSEQLDIFRAVMLQNRPLLSERISPQPLKSNPKVPDPTS